MKKALIVAVTENGVIGKDNDMPWHIPEDLKYFKKITTGHCIIMGRNTYNSIGKALPNRTNIVVSKTLEQAPEGCLLAISIDEAFKIAEEKKHQEAFIIGGANMYHEALNKVDWAYITHIKANVEGDTYFPKLPKQFTKISSESVSSSQHNVEFAVYTLNL